MRSRKHKLKKISKGHYEYRGFNIDCIGYYPPEQRVCWECTDDDGSAFGHSYSMRGCIVEIDLEIERENSPSYLQ